jgi:hypothetical protein
MNTPSTKTPAKKYTLIIVRVIIGLCFVCLCVLFIFRKESATPSSAPVILASATVPAITEMPTDKPLPTVIPTQTIATVGDRVGQGNYIITLANVETAQAYGYFAADAGNIYLSVELIFESNSNTGVSVNPLYIKVKDSDGYEYTASMFGKEPSLTSQNDLPQGEKLRGWITFEIPTTAHGLILSFEPITFLNDIRIRFDLGL